MHLCKNIYSKSANLICFNTYATQIPDHWESNSFKWNFTKEENDGLNRLRALTSYYYQSAIDIAASKQSVRLTPTSLLYTGHNADKSHVLRSAQYLHRELPVRIAHRIAGYRSLPFIVSINPTLLTVHELYIQSFKALSEFPPIKTLQDEENYSNLLKTLLNNHKDVLTNLAKGLQESKKHVTDKQIIKSILDRTLTSRLGVRMLAEHHLALKENQHNHVGIINVNFSPKALIESHVEHVGENFLLHYGAKPTVIINGHTDVTFPYIRQPLDYIINELLKNSFRATLESHGERSTLPPVKITLISNDDDFIIKISDQGMGIPKTLIDKVWEYHFTCNHWQFTSDDVDADIESYNVQRDLDNNKGLDDQIGLGQISQDKYVVPMHGFGFGLPTSKAYAEYLGGSLRMVSMRGYGCDIYLCLRHMDGKSESFRI